MNRKDIVIANARMSYYYIISNKIMNIFESFVPKNAIHQYSVDESWLTFSGTSLLYDGKTMKELAQLVIDKIKLETGIPAGIGIGPNKFLAKTMLDLYGKVEGIAEVTYDTVETRLYHIPIGKMWGIGQQLEKHMQAMNIFTYGNLAHANPEVIKKRFGIVGEKLQGYAQGFDPSPVLYDEKNPPLTAFNFRSESDDAPIKSVGNGVTLLKDYTEMGAIRIAIMDLAEEVAARLRKRGVAGKTITVGVGYSSKTGQKGFTRQITFKTPTADAKFIAETCMELFMKNTVSNPVVRFLHVGVSKLENLQEDNQITSALDIINEKFGKGTLRRAVSFTDESIAGDRAGKVNGHNK